MNIHTSYGNIVDMFGLVWFGSVLDGEMTKVCHTKRHFIPFKFYDQFGTIDDPINI